MDSAQQTNILQEVDERKAEAQVYYIHRTFSVY